MFFYVPQLLFFISTSPSEGLKTSDQVLSTNSCGSAVFLAESNSLF